jgi:hypothetical protein
VPTGNAPGREAAAQNPDPSGDGAVAAGAVAGVASVAEPEEPSGNGERKRKAPTRFSDLIPAPYAANRKGKGASAATAKKDAAAR